MFQLIWFEGIARTTYLTKVCISGQEQYSKRRKIMKAAVTWTSFRHTNLFYRMTWNVMNMKANDVLTWFGWKELRGQHILPKYGFQLRNSFFKHIKLMKATVMWTSRSQTKVFYRMTWNVIIMKANDVLSYFGWKELWGQHIWPKYEFQLRNGIFKRIKLMKAKIMWTSCSQTNFFYRMTWNVLIMKANDVSSWFGRKELRGQHI